MTDDTIARVERAIRLRMRAYEPVPPDRSMAKRAEELPPPSKNGDGGGICIDPERLVRGLQKLLREGQLPYRVR